MRILCHFADRRLGPVLLRALVTGGVVRLQEWWRGAYLISYRDGRVREVAAYRESDVVNT
jgi:hypothetical protein